MIASAFALTVLLAVQDPASEQVPLPDLDAFRERVAELRLHAMRASFTGLHGDHIRSTTFAVREPLGRRLPDPTEDPAVDEPMRPGYYTYEGRWGMARVELVDRWVADYDDAYEVLLDLLALQHAFRAQLGPWRTSTDANLLDGVAWNQAPETMLGHELVAKPHFTENGWGPSLTFRVQVEPGLGPDGAPSHRVRAWLSAFSMELDDETFPGGAAAYDQLYPGDRAGAWERRDPRLSALAEEFVAWLDGGDPDALGTLMVTAEEARDWELRRNPPHTREPGDEPLSSEEFAELYSAITADLVEATDWSRRHWLESWPVFDPSRLRVAAVRSLTELRAEFPENPDEWTEEQVDLSEYLDNFDGAFDEVAFVTIEADYPDSASLRFEVELLALRGPERVSFAGLGSDLREVTSTVVEAFTERAVAALLAGDLESYQGLLADVSAARWMLEHRASTDWSRLPSAEELVPDAGEAIDRFHLLREPLELQGWERPDSVDVERVELLSPYTEGASGQVWIIARLNYDDGSAPRVQLQVEVLHGGSDLRLPRRGRFELQVLREPFSGPLGDAGRAARDALTPVRSLRSNERLLEFLDREQVFLEGMFELDPEQRIRGLAALAFAYEERHRQATAESAENVADLLAAASYFDDAQRLELGRRGRTFDDHGALLGDATTSMRLRRIAVGCIQAAGPAAERGEDVVRLYEAAAEAGSWLLRQGVDAGLRSALTQCAVIAARTRAGFGATEGAAELLERYLPLEEDRVALEAEELAASVGLERSPAAEAYALLARLTHDGAVAMHEKRVASERPRPALRLRAIERAEAALRAARCAARLAPEEAPDTSLVDACRYLVDALRDS